MSVVEQLVRAQLVASTGVTSLVGQRVYPLILPQEPKLPAVTYDLVSNDRESVMSVDTGTAHARVQINSHAHTYGTASSVSESVRGAMQRFSSTEFVDTGFTISDSTGTNASEIFDNVTLERGQSFTLSSTATLQVNAIEARYYRSACTTGNTTYAIYTATTSHLPDTLVMTRNIPASSVSASTLTWTRFDVYQDLNPGTLYVFTISPTTAITGTTCSVYVKRGRAVPAGTGSTGMYTGGKMVFNSTTEPGWSNHLDRERDMFFRVLYTRPDEVHDTYIENETSTYDPETNTYVHTLDAIIHYEEG